LSAIFGHVIDVSLLDLVMAIIHEK